MVAQKGAYCAAPAGAWPFGKKVVRNYYEGSTAKEGDRSSQTPPSPRGRKIPPKPNGALIFWGEGAAGRLRRGRKKTRKSTKEELQSVEGNRVKKKNLKKKGRHRKRLYYDNTNTSSG